MTDFDDINTNNTPQGCGGSVLAAVAIMAAVIALLCLLPSCGTRRVVQTDKAEIATTAASTVIRDTVQVYISVRDSVSRRDSVSTLIRGDTVMIERWRYIDRWHASDTSRNASYNAVDTVRYEVTRTVTDTVEVPARLTRWQKCRMLLGDGLLCAILVAAVCAIVWWRKRK